MVARCLAVFSCATIVGPRSHSQALPLAWSKCQWVLIRCVRGSGPRSARAAATWGRETADPAIHQHLPVPAGRDGDVAARALERHDPAAEPMYGDRRLRGRG